MAQTRTLFSLTPQECQTIYALGFGYTPPVQHLQVVALAALSLIGPGHALIIYPNGAMLASKLGEEREEPAYINVWKIAMYLNHLNVAFGEETFILKPGDALG